MAYCSNCGQEVQDGVKFCNNCGAPVNGDGAQQVNAEQGRQTNNAYQYYDQIPAKESKKKRSMLTALFGIGLLILAIATFSRIRLL